jgi:hypothetical protein
MSGGCGGFFMSESSKVGDEEHLNSVKPSWIPDQEVYVIVAQRDSSNESDNAACAIIFETYLTSHRATLEGAREAIKNILNGRYGEARIAKLVFVE